MQVPDKPNDRYECLKKSAKRAFGDGVETRLMKNGQFQVQEKGRMMLTEDQDGRQTLAVLPQSGGFGIVNAPALAAATDEDMKASTPELGQEAKERFRKFNAAAFTSCRRGL